MARNWANKIFSRLKYAKEKKNKTETIPVSERQPIASQRQFTITPSSSSTTLADSSATVDSHFFRLPEELQLQILRTAFADRIIHLELTQDESHRLLGYVCPRSDARCSPRFAQDIINDDCFLKRQTEHHDYSIQKDPRKATVGALGWLMSCRKAYVETLY